jgi:hypothetical protein
LEDDEAEIVVEIDEATTRGEEIVPALCLVGRFLSTKPIYMCTYDVGEDEGDMVSTERENDNHCRRWPILISI